MIKLEIFDQPMCCSTGICGSNADPILVVFASDLEWLKQQGVDVVRYGLTMSPAEFSKNETVNEFLTAKGEKCLPILTIEDKIVYYGSYPLREELARLCNVKFNNDEAPPIHREENCCCGVDCDCRISQTPKISNQNEKCDCSNAAAENNCFCQAHAESIEFKKETKTYKIILIILFISILLLILYKITS